MSQHKLFQTIQIGNVIESIQSKLELIHIMGQYTVYTHLKMGWNQITLMSHDSEDNLKLCGLGRRHATKLNFKPHLVLPQLQVGLPQLRNCL